MERVLRLVQRVTNQGLPASSALELVVYLLPHYLTGHPAVFRHAVGNKGTASALSWW
jgi:hypothetical protein